SQSHELALSRGSAGDRGQGRDRGNGGGRRRAARGRGSGAGGSLRAVRFADAPASRARQLLRRGGKLPGRGSGVRSARTMSVAKQTPLRGHTLRIPVRFAECDSYAVVWHGHYALYLEQVREDLTGRFGFTATRALARGYRVPITRME